MAVTFGLLAAMPIRAWEVGVIFSYINMEEGGGPSYGPRIMVRQELWHYIDIGARLGYMRSDKLSIEFMPVEATIALKYPFLEERLVPFLGVGFGYHFYPSDYRSSQALTPNLGFDLRFGERKQWSFFFEGLYQFGHVHTGGHGSPSTSDDGPGVSTGISFRF